MSTKILGILNVTPDSFSDGGAYHATADAIERAYEMLEEGADIIDVGGESTRPGAAEVDVETELARVLPVVSALAPDCSVAVDTRHAFVARRVIEAGASIINDISATLWPVAAEMNAGWIAMHMQGQPNRMQLNPNYGDVVAEVKDFLVSRANQAVESGVENVWIDPGFGFGKNLDHNVTLLANLDQFVATGFPVAIGTSRKAMLGSLIAQSDGADDQTPPEDRLEGSVTTATYAMMLGAKMIRVHDVKAARQAVTVVVGEHNG